MERTWTLRRKNRPDRPGRRHAGDSPNPGSAASEPYIMRGPAQRLPTMRLILIALTLLMIASGALFGALNARRAALDFYFFSIEAPVGAALLTALLAGWLLGGFVAWLGLVPRLRRDLRAARHQLRAATAAKPVRDDA